eukprot:6171803-Pyramimonas_sp.AAC.1
MSIARALPLITPIPFSALGLELDSPPAVDVAATACLGAMWPLTARPVSSPALPPCSRHTA